VFLGEGLQTSPYLGEKMPKKMEEALKKEANKKGLKGKKKDAYIYGTLAKYDKKKKSKK